MAHAGVGTWTLPTLPAHKCMRPALPDGPSRARCPITSRFLSHRRTGIGQHNGMSVLQRKRRHTHLDIDISHRHFALRASRRAGTIPGASTARHSSSGAVQRHQEQLRVLGALQLQTRRHAQVRFSQSCSTAVRVEHERERISRNQSQCGTRRRASFTARAADGRDSPPCEQEVFPAISSHC